MTPSERADLTASIVTAMVTIKTIDKGRFYTTHDLGAKRSTTPEGFLVCHDVPIARTGMQFHLDICTMTSV